MILALSLRLRMMLLFCGVVGVLLAASDLGFYFLFASQVRAKVDGQLLEAAKPVIADYISDPGEQDVSELNIPQEYFELLDPSGRVLQRSKNLSGRSLDVGDADLGATRNTFRTLKVKHSPRLRLALLPFQAGSERRILAVAAPTREADDELETFREISLLLLPLTLVLTAAISSWYVGRSLRPISHLTRHAAQLTERLREPGGGEVWKPLRIANPHDELGRLGETFNQLFTRVDAALRQLRQFVTDASHELRTPLAVLQGETELLLAGPRRAEEYERTLRVIHDELKKLARIVEGLFTLAMADAGELRLASEPLYLDEVVEETCALAGPLAEAKGIALERELERDVPFRGDEAFLRQLFLIFLDNAIKYSPPRTRVRVKLEKSNGAVRVRFEDQGPGIASQHLPRIFERFYRAAPPGSGEAQSGGLGLAIAQAIARAQGGSIDCQSAPGRGSTFTVTLPLKNNVN